jgi:hypothetical protein
MRNMRKYPVSLPDLRLASLLAALMFIANGCGIHTERMVPVLPSYSELKVGSVRVMPVIGGQKSTFGGAELISDKQFLKALIPALERSGLFTAVGTDKGDFDFYASIRTQDQKTSRGLQYTARMVVSYKITDHFGNILWSDTFDSESSSVAFSGATRTVQAREGSARENLAALIKSLRERWPGKRHESHP